MKCQREILTPSVSAFDFHIKPFGWNFCVRAWYHDVTPLSSIYASNLKLTQAVTEMNISSINMGE